MVSKNIQRIFSLNTAVLSDSLLLMYSLYFSCSMISESTKLVLKISSRRKKGLLGYKRKDGEKDAALF